MSRLRELNSKKALTPEEVSEQYGLSKGTLANLRSKKQGAKFFRVGGGRKILYRIEDLESWLYQNPVMTIDSHNDR
ncbi:MAG: helix-turn-helix domain-containing protein [Proteobacteria bacterium]|nr:helix-turn-helix domain-containing protein [Pseudomonadota bacterium]